MAPSSSGYKGPGETGYDEHQSEARQAAAAVTSPGLTLVALGRGSKQITSGPLDADFDAVRREIIEAEVLMMLGRAEKWTAPVHQRRDRSLR